MCCVCGDGLSLEPNIIVFCERCDIAVHQACYGVRNIPAGERNEGRGERTGQTLGGCEREPAAVGRRPRRQAGSM